MVELEHNLSCCYQTEGSKEGESYLSGSLFEPYIYPQRPSRDCVQQYQSSAVIAFYGVEAASRLYTSCLPI